MPIKVGNKWVERPKEKEEREKKEKAKEKVKQLKKDNASVKDRLDVLEEYLGL